MDEKKAEILNSEQINDEQINNDNKERYKQDINAVAGAIVKFIEKIDKIDKNEGNGVN